MERKPKTLADAAKLLSLSKLLQSSAEALLAEWSSESEHYARTGSLPLVPAQGLYEQQRTILGITGALTELVADPSLRVMEVACQYWETRALYILAERRVPDLLAENPGGLEVGKLAERVGIEKDKLARLLRSMCSNHIFSEVADGVFANNAVSEALVRNEPLRAYVLNFNLDLYATAEHLPHVLLDPKTRDSYAVDETAFQRALGTTKSRWDWLEEEIPDLTKEYASPAASGGFYPSLPESIPGVPSTRLATAQGLSPKRPEHEIFTLAMLGGGRVHGAAHPYDYPWGALGSGTVVDIGGGVGGFLLQLSHLYPELRLVLQDRPQTIAKARADVWPAENPAALAAGRISFVEHDFFQPNPTPGAHVYWLRSVLHDWSDDYCVQMLQAIKPAMAPHSCILICDMLINTTQGAPEVRSAPAPLPANYGAAVRFSHQRDLCMMGLINGVERTPGMMRDIVERAGLKLHKVWECRSQVPIVEVRLP